MKKNILANFFSQIFATIVGFVAIPYYIDILGNEAYGLIGFFGLVVVLFQLLDIGFSPTFTREVARFRGGGKSSYQLWKLFNWLCVFFSVTSIFGVVIMYFASDFIGGIWLKIEVLNLSDTITAVKLIGLIVAIKWISGFLKSVLQGFEEIVYLSVVNTITIALATITVIPVLLYINSSVITFFIVQLVSVIVEFILLFFYALKIMPVKAPKPLNEGPEDFRKVLNFALGIGFTSSIWILVTQLDKLLLSKYIPLSEFGFFSIGVLAASGVNMVGGPIRQAILPRLTKLFAEKEEKLFLSTYRSATQVVSVIAFSVCIILALFAKDILILWLKDEVVASKSALILQLYAITNGLIAVGVFPSMLQYAKGKLHLHILGNLFFVILYLPALFYCVMNYGAIGASSVWFGANLLYLLVWVPLTNFKVQPGINKDWILTDVLFIMIPCFVLNLGFKFIRDQLFLNEVELFIYISCISFSSLIITSLFSPYLRGFITSKIKKYVSN